MKPINLLQRTFAAIFILFCFTVLANSQIIAIRAGKIVDPETGTIQNNQIILIEGQNIKAIGADVKFPADATVVDLSKQTVLPGLFDAHTHLCMNVQYKRDGGGNYFITSLLDSNALRAIQGAANARSMLEYGFTTVRDVGNAGNYADTDLRRAIEQEIVPGPTIINAGRIIAPFGGQFRLQPDKPELGNPEYFYADTLDELKKAVRQNIHFGARVIKIVVDDQRYIYSVEDIKFIVEEAHLAGLKVAAHCSTEKGARNAAEGGVDSIEHGLKMTDEIMEIAKSKNIALVPTPYTETEARINGEPSNKEANQELFINPVKRAYKIGVQLVFGPDVGFTTKEYPRGRLSIETIDNWKEAGIPPLVILQALTSNAAKLLGVEKTRGALRVGMRADIIAVGDNPLDKIETLEKVGFVMKSGKVFKQNSVVK